MDLLIFDHMHADRVCIEPTAVGSVTIVLQDAVSMAPLFEASLTVRVIDNDELSLYRRVIKSQDNRLVMDFPAERHVLVIARSDGYLPTARSFFVHHHEGMI